MEENDVMIRLIQGVNKAVQDKERDERDIAKGYRTVEEIKVSVCVYVDVYVVVYVVWYMCVCMWMCMWCGMCV